MASRPSGGVFRGLVAYLPTVATVVILIGAVGLFGWSVFYPREGAESPEILRFIALLIIFMIALAATATLFYFLGIHNGSEAFGLPSGSIPALLAMGIMMLFVVFGLPVITPSSEPVVTDRVTIPQAQLSETVRLNREQGSYVQVLNPGSPAVSAVVEIRGRVPVRSAEEMDLTKQMLTAIITLLTTVIGFYFGSRTSTEAIQASQSGGNPGSGGGLGSPPGGAAPGASDLAAMQDEATRALGTINAALASAEAAIEEKRSASTAPEASPEVEESARQIGEVRQQVEALTSKVEEGRATLESMQRSENPQERTRLATLAQSILAPLAVELGRQALRIAAARASLS